MAKISAALRQQNLERYNDEVVSQFFENGWHNVSLGTVAKAMGIQRSTLQSYYPDGLKMALKGRIFPVIQAQLDFSSEQAFIESWLTGLDNKKFKYVIELFIGNAISDTPSEFSIQGMDRLIKIIEEKFGNSDLLHIVLGQTVLKLLHKQT